MEVTMADKTKTNQVPDEAKFLFKGTVRKLGATALAQVPKGEETAIVRVDEVLLAPPALAKTVGKEITVKLAKGAKPKVGDQVLFHANGWLFGKTVAVESVKQEAPAQAKAIMAGRTADPTRNLKDRELENRVASADMVVEGEVSSVHLPESEMAATWAAGPSRPVSEHDPKWREAVVTVKTVHKGEPTTKQVVVRFPSSMDVQWHLAPKFHAGDRGVWVLHSPKAPDAGAAAQPKGAPALAMTATAIPGAAVYTALSPMDFHPASQADTVASVIRAAKNS
jgi:hypothetical protein